jgi:hypothetical protein
MRKDETSLAYPFSWPLAIVSGEGGRGETPPPPFFERLILLTNSGEQEEACSKSRLPEDS